MFPLPAQAQAFESCFFLTRVGIPVSPRDDLLATRALRSAMVECETWAAQQILTASAAPFTTAKRISDFIKGLEAPLKQQVSTSLKKHPLASASALEVLLEDSKPRWESLIRQAMGTKPNESQIHQTGFMPSLDPSLLEPNHAVDESSFHTQTQQVCKEFGFAFFQIAGDSDMGIASREMLMKRVTSSLADACQRLGINNCDFGGGRTGFCVDRQLSALENVVGRFTPSSGTLSRIHWDPSSPQATGSLVHEFVHRLDNLLGIKALELISSRDGKDNPPLKEGVYFSELSFEQRSVIPLAEKGLKKVIDSLGKESRQVEDPLNVINKALDEVCDNFIATTMGPVKFANAPQKRIKEWTSILKSDNHLFLRSLAQASSSSEPIEFGKTFFGNYRKEKGLKHPFAIAIESIESKFTTAPTLGFFKALTQAWPALKKIHALTAPTSSLNDSTASKKDSALKTLSRYARPAEFLAAALSDPQSVKDYTQSTMKKAQLSVGAWEARNAIRGYSQMAEACGFSLNRSPTLRGEKSIQAEFSRGKTKSMIAAEEIIALLSGTENKTSNQLSIKI